MAAAAAYFMSPSQPTSTCAPDWAPNCKSPSAPEPTPAIFPAWVMALYSGPVPGVVPLKSTAATTASPCHLRLPAMARVLLDVLVQIARVCGEHGGCSEAHHLDGLLMR